MTDDERFLLLGTYEPPALRKGDVTTCLYRDCDVVITSMTNARIPWPRCRAVSSPHGGSGLLINETMVRAIKTESALALKYWFGVSTHAVWNWRRSFGVEQLGTQGSRRLHDAASRKGTAAVRGKKQSPKFVRQRQRVAKRLNLAQHLRDYHAKTYPPHRWTKAELALLGTMPDSHLAERLGIDRVKVKAKREDLGIPIYHGPKPRQQK